MRESCVKNKLRVVAIIPARGGSKEIPNKNIIDLVGKPLIAYTIEVAKKAKYVDRVIVSTDSYKIAEIAKKYGAEVPFMRPVELASDDAPSLFVLQHCVKYLEENEDYHPDIIVELLPTAPLRTVEDIDEAIKKFIDTKADTVVGLVEVKQHPYWMMKVNVNGKAIPYYKNYEKYTRRQDLPKLYMIAGTICVLNRNTLMKREGLIFGGKIVAYIMPEEKCINIDTIADLKLAELLIMERTQSKRKVSFSSQ